jgi:hypothetical protein
LLRPELQRAGTACIGIDRHPRCVLQDQATPAPIAQADIDKFLHPETNVWFAVTGS